MSFAPMIRSAVAAIGLSCSCAAFATNYFSTVLIEGLHNPRQLAFAPDGSLYVTEAGVASGSGPTTIARGETETYTTSGSVTRYASGTASRILTGLPSIYGATSLDVVGRRASPSASPACPRSPSAPAST